MLKANGGDLLRTSVLVFWRGGVLNFTFLHLDDWLGHRFGCRMLYWLCIGLEGGGRYKTPDRIFLITGPMVIISAMDETGSDCRSTFKLNGTKGAIIPSPTYMYTM